MQKIRISLALAVAITWTAAAGAMPTKDAAVMDVDTFAREVVKSVEDRAPLTVFSLAKLVGREVNARRNEWPINEARLAVLIQDILERQGVEVAWTTHELTAAIHRLKNKWSTPRCGSRLKARTSIGNPECRGRFNARGNRLTVFNR